MTNMHKLSIGILSLALILFGATQITSGVVSLKQVAASPTLTPSNGKIVVFVPGLGLNGSDYQTTIDAIKAKGYTVKVYEPIDQDPSDYNRIVRSWVYGIESVAQKDNVIVVGHSIGGAAAVSYCATHKQCKAGINLDGGPAKYEKLSVPFLYVQGGTGRYCDKQCLDGRSLMEKITKNSKTKIVKIPAIKHMNFTDLRTPDLYAQDLLSLTDGRTEIHAAITGFLK